MQWTTFVGDCDCATVLLATATVFIVLMYFLKSGRPKNLPPGPIGLPIVGYAPFLGNNAAETLRKLKSKYGPVITVRMGMDDWVILNNNETINEALVKQGEKFSGRPSNYALNQITEGGYGILVTDYGPVWKSLKKFGLMTLKGFGVGKKSMERNIEEEMTYLIENLLKDDRETVTMKLTPAVANIICRVVFGSRFSYDDKRFLELVRIIRKFFSDDFDTKAFGVLMLTPALRHIPPFKGALKRLVAENQIYFGILRELIKEHEDSYDENDIRDFIDAFLKEMKEKTNDPSFCEVQMVQFVRNLFEAGTGTSSSTLSWAILCFTHHPEYQEKIHEEVEKVMGESGIPTMKHRDEMPYTCAFIHELMRHRTVTPLGVLHKTNEEATLRGFTIPKNTTVVPNIWAVHMDPELFENPEEFRPERYLDSDGKFVPSRHAIPFSVGPRRCLGEQIGRMNTFIFLTGIVQKLKILPDPNHPPPPFIVGDFSNTITFDPLEFTVKFEKW